MEGGDAEAFLNKSLFKSHLRILEETPFCVSLVGF